MVVPRITKSRRQSGVTLIELVCALAVVSTLAVGVLQSGKSQTTTILNAFQETVALRVAQSALESTRTSTFAMPVDTRQNYTVDADSARVLPEVSAELSVQSVEDGPAGLVRVRSVVEWLPTGSRQRRTLRLTSLRALGGKRR